MGRNLTILFLAALVVALPFVARERGGEAGSSPVSGRPVLTIVSPHNEAIRYEFGRAFSEWHARAHGTPVDVQWIAIGGTTEIARYLDAQYVAAVRAWWQGRGRPWPAGASEALLDRKFAPKNPPRLEPREGEGPEALAHRRAEAEGRWKELAELHAAYRATDDPAQFTSRVDVFFGGGEYDHQKAAGAGCIVPPWPAGREPPGLLRAADGTELIPERVSGENWRTPYLFGNAVSTFGISYNVDRLRDLGISTPPAGWDDLAAPAYFRTLALTDPTKSASVAKTYEVVIQQKCGAAVRAAGFDEAEIERYEKAIAAAKLPPGMMPPEVPAAYQRAVEGGWLEGVRLIQRIGANARYFSDTSTKLPLDVAAGAAAAGIGIDFLSRFQAEYSRGPDGRERLVFVNPAGGSIVNADPVSLMRGAEHRELAVRFIEFVLGEEGQKIWCYRAGAPGGPHKFSLRRLPIRREFYPSTNTLLQAAYERHRAHAADDLSRPDINPYILANLFVYRPRWTGAHFGLLRDFVRAMCLDSQEELQAAWEAVIAHGGPARQPEAMAQLGRLPGEPDPLTWGTILEQTARRDRLEYLREWTAHFRASYRRAQAIAARGAS